MDSAANLKRTQWDLFGGVALAKLIALAIVVMRGTEAGALLL